MHALVDRCSSVRIVELVLNICDVLLVMPNTDIQGFLDPIIRIVLRSYLHFGCPNGCNEGMRTTQADFLRAKAKSLLSQMHRSYPHAFTEAMKAQVAERPSHQFLDCLHAMTVFCDVEIGSEYRY